MFQNILLSDAMKKDIQLAILSYRKFYILFRQSFWYVLAVYVFLKVFRLGILNLLYRKCIIGIKYMGVRIFLVIFSACSVIDMVRIRFLVQYFNKESTNLR